MGIDLGGRLTKVVICQLFGGKFLMRASEEGSKDGSLQGLRSTPLISWKEQIDVWIQQHGFQPNEVKGIGISLAVPFLKNKLDDKTEKFKEPQGKPILRNVPIGDAENAIRGNSDRKVAILHDGAAALFGEIAGNPDAKNGSVGMLTFGRSIGFGWARDGSLLTNPYTSWVSHLQLRPTFPALATNSVTCPGCKQQGCWRLLYQSLKGDGIDPRIECLPALLEVTSQGISSVLNVLPMDRLFLGGGWAQYILNDESDSFDARLKAKALTPFRELKKSLKPRICIDPEEVLRFAQGGDNSGAIGAAYYALNSLDQVVPDTSSK